jgi:5-methylcytosine-specific restriction endonuclease McrA
MALSYGEQMNHPLWFKKRKEILERDGYSCTICGSDIHRLEVHHLCYHTDLLAWEYDDELMVTVCRKHHEQITYDMPKIAGLIAFQCLKDNIDLTTLNQTLLNLKSL